MLRSILDRYLIPGNLCRGLFQPNHSPAGHDIQIPGHLEGKPAKVIVCCCYHSSLAQLGFPDGRHFVQRVSGCHCLACCSQQGHRRTALLPEAFLEQEVSISIFNKLQQENIQRLTWDIVEIPSSKLCGHGLKLLDGVCEVVCFPGAVSYQLVNRSLVPRPMYLILDIGSGLYGWNMQE